MEKLQSNFRFEVKTNDGVMVDCNLVIDYITNSFNVISSQCSGFSFKGGIERINIEIARAKCVLDALELAKKELEPLIIKTDGDRHILTDNGLEKK
jgi:hypothetical protein